MRDIKNHPDHNAAHYGRDEIKQGLFQTIAADIASTGLMQPLTQQQREESLANFLAARPQSAHQIWVFAYGSLIWNPGFDYVTSDQAMIYGYHRKFCLKAFVGRGCAQHPGLLLGLDKGGSCKGIAFKLSDDHYTQELAILWDREMMGGSYKPIWLAGRLENGDQIWLISFVIRHDTNRYFKGDDLKLAAGMIDRASGALGPCKDYVFNTAKALKDHGIHTKLMNKMVNLLSTPNLKGN
ncbi:MAG: gamma-glutamylcyclotransferase [Alphaproteobacteria bacterium]